ncbi:unnamed protein product, partial [marine sediment metagenome]
MRITRYNRTKGNVRELQSQKANLVPGRALAAAAAAPYNAVAQVAGQVYGDIGRIQQRDEQLQREEDAISQKLAMEQLKAKTIQWENNPGYDNQSQENGDPTASTMLTEFEGIFEF